VHCNCSATHCSPARSRSRLRRRRVLMRHTLASAPVCPPVCPNPVRGPKIGSRRQPSSPQKKRAETSKISARSVIPGGLRKPPPSASRPTSPRLATILLPLPQGDQRVQLEPRGARRLSSQSLLDLRVSRSVTFGKLGRVELMVDVLNAVNDTAEEGACFGQPVQSELRTTGPVRGSAPRDGERATESRAIATERGKTPVIDASASTDCSPICTGCGSSYRTNTDSVARFPTW
jgi:hypothetical protein